MHKNIPNLTTLRAFEAAARLGSFAEAAKELYLTPPAISRAIARLENDLGYPLFHRTHRAVSLTDAGARYAQRTTEAFRQLSIDATDGTPETAKITIDVEATFLRQWLLPRLGNRAFRELEVTLSVRTHDNPPRVIPASSDLAIVWGFADYNGFKRTRLASPKTILAASPELKVTQLADAANAGLIHEANDHWWQLIYQEAGIPYPRHAKSLTLTRCDIPIEAARLGLGVCVADDVIAEKELRSGALIPVDGPRLDSQDYFMMSRKTPPVPVRKLAAWLINEAKLFSDWQRTL